MKTLRILIAAALIVCLTSVAPVFANSKTTYKNLKGLKSKTLSMTSVKVSWKKIPGVKRYVVYKYNSSHEKKKKLKIVSGKKSSVVLRIKKNKWEDLYVKGVKKRKNGKKVVYGSSIRVFSGLPRPEWDEHLMWEYHSPNEIHMSFGIEESGGLEPTGFEIYKKEAGTKKYKLVKTLKIRGKNIDWGGWKDESVKPGKYYYYKVCSYLKSNGKIYRSEMSNRCYLGAVNYEGKFRVQTETDEDTMTLKVTSDLLNGRNYGWIGYDEGFPAKEENVCYMIDATSDDGHTWISSDNKWGSASFYVKPGESFWIRLKRVQDETQYNEFIRRERPVGKIYMNCDYCGNDDACMWINVYKDTAICQV